jgi:hypothetical protein
MRLHVDGWDKERGAYRVVRTYHPRKNKHAFAWFIEETEAERFCDLAVHLRDADEVSAIKEQERSSQGKEVKP